MIRMLLVTLLFFFGPALLMFALHRLTMIFRIWWRIRQHQKNKMENIIDLSPNDNTAFIRPGPFFITASIIVAMLCAFIAWQNMQGKPETRKSTYVPSHLDADGRLIPSHMQPCSPKK